MRDAARAATWASSISPTGWRNCAPSATASPSCATAARCTPGPLAGNHHRPHHPAHGGTRDGLASISASRCPPGEELLRVENLSRQGQARRYQLYHPRRRDRRAGRVDRARAARSCAARSSAWTRVDSGTYLGRRTPGEHPLAAGGGERRDRAGHRGSPEDRARAAAAHRRQHHAGQRAARSAAPGFSTWRASGTSAARIHRAAAHQAQSPARQLAGRLSGGNQQKVVIAKWLFRNTRVFLFDEPTRGIDVGAKVEVFEVMDGLARVRRGDPDGQLGNAGAAAGGRPHPGDAPGTHHRRTARTAPPRRRSCATRRSNGRRMST